VTADYRTARDRLGELVHSNLLNTDDAEPVYLRYQATADDPDPVLGTITDGELVALAEHRCDLTALRAEVESLRDGCLRQWRSVNYALPEAQPEARAWIAGYEAASIEVLDLIDKHKET
jgi:hypothetical protein